MSWRDYCEPGPWDDDEQDEAAVTCKYCGRGELFWVEIEAGKWRLTDSDGDLHHCNRNSNPADDFGPPPTTCTYTKGQSDGYGTDWTTACGHAVRCEGAIEVGFSFDPLPNEGGKFCSYCGKLIKL